MKKMMLINKNYTLFFIGTIVSLLGSVFMRFAMTLFILDLTGKASLMSIFFAVFSIIHVLLQPIMGTISDRFNKAKLISRLDFIFGATDLMFYLVLIFSNDTTIILTALFINGVINSIVSSMYEPTYSSMIPILVKEDEMTSAYSYMSTVQNIQVIIGLLLASLMYMLLGFKLLVLINGISFVITAIMEQFITVADPEPKPKEEGQLLKELREGFNYIYERKELLNMAKIAVMMNIFLTGIVAITMPFMINTDLGLEPIVLASAMVSMSLGGMIMAMKLSKEEITNAGRRLGIGFLVGVISFALVTVNYYLISTGVYSGLVFLGFLVIIFLVFGASGSFIQIPLNVSYASRVDKEVMGRVMAFRSTLSTIASPVAMVVFGFIIDYTNVLTAMIFGTLGMLLVTIYTYRNEHIKAL